LDTGRGDEMRFGIDVFIATSDKTVHEEVEKGIFDECALITL
jgi:hypothetical protein